jgi:hypothetical protein
VECGTAAEGVARGATGEGGATEAQRLSWVRPDSGIVLVEADDTIGSRPSTARSVRFHEQI